jgi:hypothetical protein
MICCSMESVMCPPGVLMRFMPSRLFSLRVSGCGGASCPPCSRSPCVSTAGRHDGPPCAAALVSEEPEDRLRQVRQASRSRRRHEVIRASSEHAGQQGARSKARTKNALTRVK